MSRLLRFSTVLSVFLFLFCSLSSAATQDPLSPTQSRNVLEKRGKIGNRAISESSGLVKSRRWLNLFWTHNDSGDGPRIFAIKGDGTNVDNGSTWNAGIQVTGAENIDWEDIAIDDNGYLIIGDIGNNVSHRSLLALYRVREPDPFRDQVTLPAETIAVYFPDRLGPAFDSEALFWAKGSIYLLTKTRGGTNTGLYRLDANQPKGKEPLIRIGSFDFGAPVTAADASPDGRHLAVLTYRAVWLFERPVEKDNYLRGKRSSFSFRIWQCEAVCFDDGKLLISNEGRRLFELDVGVLLPLK
jgi:hypothetical protein